MTLNIPKRNILIFFEKRIFDYYSNIIRITNIRILLYDSLLYEKYICILCEKLQNLYIYESKSEREGGGRERL